MRRLTSSSLSLAVAALLASVAMSACLGRTGISADDLAALGVSDPHDGATAETGDDSTAPDTTPAPDTAKTDAGPDRIIDIWEVLPIPDGGPIGDCLGCVRDKCGSSVNDCINSPACRSGLACTITTCAAGGLGGGGGLGGLDIGCVAKCFGGDFKAAATAISTFSCLLGTCGSKCGGLLGGGGGDAGPKPDAPAPKEAGTAEAGGSGGSPGSGGLPATPGFEMPGVDGPRLVPSQGLTAEQFVALPPGTRIYFYPEALSPWAEQLHATACAEKMISCDP